MPQPETAPTRFTYTDSSGDRLTAEPAIGVDGLPVVALTAEQGRDIACVHIPLDQVENLIAGLRRAAAPATDETGPSHRAGLRHDIAMAIALRHNGAASDGRGWFRNEEERQGFLADADHVLTVLCREWPWLRAEAEDAAPADRAAVIAEAIRRVEDPEERAKTSVGLGLGWETARDVLRRLADEAQQQPAAARQDGAQR